MLAIYSHCTMKPFTPNYNSAVYSMQAFLVLVSIAALDPVFVCISEPANEYQMSWKTEDGEDGHSLEQHDVPDTE